MDDDREPGCGTVGERQQARAAEEQVSARVEECVARDGGEGPCLPVKAHGAIDRSVLQERIRVAALEACQTWAVPYLVGVIQYAQAHPSELSLRRSAVNAALGLMRYGVPRDQPTPDTTVDTLRELRLMMSEARALVDARLSNPAPIGTQPVAASNGAATPTHREVPAEVTPRSAPRLTSTPEPDEEAPGTIARRPRRGRPAKGERPSRQALSWIERKPPADPRSR